MSQTQSVQATMPHQGTQTSMEGVDNAIMLLLPWRHGGRPGRSVILGNLVMALVLAGAVAFPMNRWLIARGQGHVLVHAQHGH